MFGTNEGPRLIAWAPLHNSPYSNELIRFYILSISIQEIYDANFTTSYYFQFFLAWAELTENI